MSYGGYGNGAGEPPQGGPEGSSPTFTLSPWAKRLGAYLLDGLIVSVVLIPGVFMVTAASAMAADGSGGGGGIGLLLGLLLYLVAFGFSIWQYVFVQGKTGQTIGKKTLGIKLVSEADAQPIGPLNSFLRQICHILDSVPCVPVGYLFPLWDEKRQTFADKIMKTVVIDVK